MPQPQFPLEQSGDGRFVRQGDAFRGWVRAEPSAAFGVEAGRYHLYVSLACPWAHRTIIVRRLVGLEAVIGMTVVDPIRDELGWAFRNVPGRVARSDQRLRLSGRSLSRDRSHYHGRVTVPYCGIRARIASSATRTTTFMRMFETEFGALAQHPELTSTRAGTARDRRPQRGDLRDGQ